MEIAVVDGDDGDGDVVDVVDDVDEEARPFFSFSFSSRRFKVSWKASPSITSSSSIAEAATDTGGGGGLDRIEGDEDTDEDRGDVVVCWFTALLGLRFP